MSADIVALVVVIGFILALVGSWIIAGLYRRGKKHEQQ